MITNVLNDIGGVGIYGIISISLFFIVFLAAVARTCLLRKSHVNRVSELPLEDGTVPESSGPRRESLSPDFKTP